MPLDVCASAKPGKKRGNRAGGSRVGREFLVTATCPATGGGGVRPYPPGVMKHDLLENGPEKSMIFPARNRLLLRDSPAAMFDETMFDETMFDSY